MTLLYSIREISREHITRYEDDFTFNLRKEDFINLDSIESSLVSTAMNLRVPIGRYTSLYIS
jgi:hypothetical protein